MDLPELGVLKELIEKLKNTKLLGVSLAEKTHALIDGLKLQKVELGVLHAGVADMGLHLCKFSTALETFVGVIMAQTEDKVLAKQTCKEIMDIMEQMTTDIFVRTLDEINKPAEMNKLALPSKIVFAVEKLIADGMPHGEAALAVVNDVVKDPKERSAALMQYYKNRFSEELLKRTKELCIDGGLPKEAATLQAIEEIIDNDEIKQRLKERMFLVGSASQMGLPPELLKALRKL